MKLSRRIRGARESMTMAVMEKARQLQRRGVEVISLGAGEPDFDTPEPIKEAAIRALREGRTKYTDADGIPELKEAIRARLAETTGQTYMPDEIVVSCGAKHAIYNLVQVLLDEGDEALVPQPYWTSYPDIVRLAAAQPVIVPAGREAGFKIHPEDLLRKITDRTRVLILNSPSNPTGVTYSADEIRALAEVCVKRGIYIISDEIYEPFTYDGVPHTSLLAAHPEGREFEIVVSGVSKIYAMTGWRIGYAAGPREIMRACAKLQSQSTSNPNSIAQYAACRALHSDPALVTAMVEEYRRRRDLVLRKLDEVKGITCVRPTGAFYVFPDVASHYGRSVDGRKINDSVTWAETLLERYHVALVPGIAFGEDRCVRISYATSPGHLNRAMERIAEFARSLQ